MDGLCDGRAEKPTGDSMQSSPQIRKSTRPEPLLGWWDKGGGDSGSYGLVAWQQWESLWAYRAAGATISITVEDAA